mmetsp:Transcript_26943/g.83390  ORF Transcript_26943/g.83390 Transcript_26943/m.83390 type:complete len:918 (-) Transcript_26943:299-3052(-)
MAMLCEVDAPTQEEQESDDKAVADANAADLVLDIEQPKGVVPVSVATCSAPIADLWRARRGTCGALRVRGLAIKARTAEAIHEALRCTPQLRVLEVLAPKSASEELLLRADALAVVVADAQLLEHLSVSGATDDALRVIAPTCGESPFKYLQSLCLEACQLSTCQTLANIIVIPTLQRLKIDAVELDLWNDAVNTAEKEDAAAMLHTLVLNRVRSIEGEWPVELMMLPSSVFANLTHFGLYAGDVPIVGVPGHLGLGKLETFVGCVDSEDFRELDHMRNLRFLEVTHAWGFDMAAVAPRVAALPHLECGRATQEWSCDPLDFFDASAAAFPQAPPKATIPQLMVVASRGNWVDEPLTEHVLSFQLPNVRLIDIGSLGFPEPTPSNQDLCLFGGLASLRTLQLSDITGLEHFTRALASLDSAPLLETLAIKRCPGLQAISADPAKLPRLTTVRLGTPELEQRLSTWQFLAQLKGLRELEFSATADVIRAAQQPFLENETAAGRLRRVTLPHRHYTPSTPSPSADDMQCVVKHLTRIRKLSLPPFHGEAAHRWLSELPASGKATLEELSVRGFDGGYVDAIVAQPGEFTSLKVLEVPAPTGDDEAMLTRLGTACPRLRMVALYRLQPTRFNTVIVPRDDSVGYAGATWRWSASAKWEREIVHRKLSDVVRRILGRVTPQNYDAVKKELFDVPIRQSTDEEITDVANLLHTKAVHAENELTIKLYATVIADLVKHAGVQNDGKAIRKAVIDQCQQHFEKPPRLAADDELEDADGTDPLPPEEIDRNSAQLKAAFHANVMFLGHLFLAGVVHEKVVVFVLFRLQHGHPREETTAEEYCPEECELEMFADLLRTVVTSLSRKTHTDYIAAYMKRVEALVPKLSGDRTKRMLQDLQELYKNEWVETRRAASDVTTCPVEAADE